LTRFPPSELTSSILMRKLIGGGVLLPSCVQHGHDDQLSSATDRDGDSITYSAEGLPSGATFAGQTFNWKPDYSQAGTYQVIFTATDGQPTPSKHLCDQEKLSVMSNGFLIRTKAL